jgi:hypothetical protein
LQRTLAGARINEISESKKMATKADKRAKATKRKTKRKTKSTRGRAERGNEGHIGSTETGRLLAPARRAD